MIKLFDISLVKKSGEVKRVVLSQIFSYKSHVKKGGVKVDRWLKTIAN